jgi:S-adenosylmethionine:tRNA ribosyltransferase-isomerase
VSSAEAPAEGEPLSLADYDYELPPERIAQEPAARRDDSRLLVLRRESGVFEHRRFGEIADLLEAGDVLALNDTRVIPARLRARKETGGRVEVLLLEPASAGDAEESHGAWRVLLRPGKAARAPAALRLLERPEVTLRTLGRDGEVVTVLFEREGERLRAHQVFELCDQVGETPLPPYIHREPGAGRRPEDRERYQTVFARAPGSAAAPTAGLHFTANLLATLESRGVERVPITLHVGIDTFRPLSEETLRAGELHGERVSIAEAAAQRLIEARTEGRRIVAVGTTTARALESFAAAGCPLPYRARTRLFIRPPYRFSLLGGLLTNFHLPRSSLLLLVCAFAGRDRVLAAYAEAISLGYRFYSYGDAMLIL